MDGDSLVLVGPADVFDMIVMQSGGGYFLRFSLSEIPEKKKGALGVNAMKLDTGDEIENAYLYASRHEFSIEYKDKQISLNKIKLGKRSGKGIKIRS